MDTRRSVRTYFWDDPYIEELDTSEKLLFLYLITAPFSNLAGVYEITIRKIASHTGLDRKKVEAILEKFQKDQKITFFDGFVIVHNFIKNQQLNQNMKICVSKIIEGLPANVRSRFETITKPLPNHSLTIGEDTQKFSKQSEIENEMESESEREAESEKDFGRGNAKGGTFKKKLMKTKTKRPFLNM